jgi:WD40 repeat protein
MSFQAHANYTYNICFLADEKILASGGYDSTMKLWDISG